MASTAKNNQEVIISTDGLSGRPPASLTGPAGKIIDLAHTMFELNNFDPKMLIKLAETKGIVINIDIMKEVTDYFELCKK